MSSPRRWVRTFLLWVTCPSTSAMRSPLAPRPSRARAALRGGAPSIAQHNIGPAAGLYAMLVLCCAMLCYASAMLCYAVAARHLSACRPLPS